jgi:DNA mismatch endonuclease (patch repair protein)
LILRPEITSKANENCGAFFGGVGDNKPKPKCFPTNEMTDRLNPDERSQLMRKVKSKHTTPELEVRSLLHRLGFRFRLHCEKLPGTPDIVLPKRRLVVFVHGCFWHGHNCKKGKLPKSNLSYWQPKIEANRVRDRRKEDALTQAKWRVAVVWQCELSNRESLEARLLNLLTPSNS